MHDMRIDIAQLLVIESFGKCADNGESQLLPKRDGTFIGADHEVELHRLITGFLCLNQAMLSHRFSDAFPVCNRADHERCVGDVRTKVTLIGDQFIESDDTSLEFRHKGGDIGIQPIDMGVFTTGSWQENVGVAGCHHSVEDGPHCDKISFCCSSNLHLPRFK